MSRRSTTGNAEMLDALVNVFFATRRDENSFAHIAVAYELYGDKMSRLAKRVLRYLYHKYRNQIAVLRRKR